MLYKGDLKIMHPAGIFLFVFLAFLEDWKDRFLGRFFFKFPSSSLRINEKFQHTMTSIVRGFNKGKILNRLRVMKERETKYDVHIRNFTLTQSMN